MNCLNCQKKVYESRIDKSSWCNKCHSFYFAGIFLEKRNAPLSVSGLIIRRDGNVYDFEQKKVRTDLTIKLFSELKDNDLLNFAKSWWESLSMINKIQLWKEKRETPQMTEQKDL